MTFKRAQSSLLSCISMNRLRIVWQGYINFRLTKTRVAKGFCVTRNGPKICRVMRDLIENFSVICDWNPPLQTSTTPARSS